MTNVSSTVVRITPQSRSARRSVTVVIVLAVLASLLAVAAPADATVGAPLAAAQNAVVKAINNARVGDGLPALAVDTRLVASARAHNVMMDKYNQLSHQLPGEADFGQLLSAQGVTWTAAAENLGETHGLGSDNGVSSALQLHKLMIDEKPPPHGQSNHYSNIMDPDVDHLGVSVVYDSTTKALWLTEDFAAESNPPAPCPAGFPDVSSSNPFCADITWLAQQKITTGNADGTFAPASSVSRQAMAVFLYRYANPGQTPARCSTAPFTDVKTNNPFCSDIAWLAQRKITTGNADGTFAPASSISRQAMAAFLHRLATTQPA